MAFLGTFMAYAIVFLAFVACAGLAFFVGMKVRQSKNNKTKVEE